MIQHDFSKQDNRQLLFLRNSLQRTLRNKECVHISVPINETLAQIEREMTKRGLTVIKPINQSQ